MKGGRSKSLWLRIVPPILSLGLISITWFYIFRFILHYQFSSESYFDDAYKDVLSVHYFSSTQLLTWAIVAVVWAADEEYHRSIPFLLFGFLGAISASFVLWIPSRAILVSRKDDKDKIKQKQTFVPIAYAITSILAFVCILQMRPCTETTTDLFMCSPDTGFGSFLVSFRFWLHGLHVILLVPIFISSLPIRQIQVDSALLYGLMGLVISFWHVLQLCDSNTSYVIPESDCQKSIHIDLVCCSLLTLYAIYFDAEEEEESGKSSALRAIRDASVSALLMPIISPAAVLSFHLCIRRLPASYGELVGKMQRSMAKQRSGKEEEGWCNLGLWNNNLNKDDGYEKACENLALALAKEVELGARDTVLSCGCGIAGKELSLYNSHFDLGHITGMDPCIRIDCHSFDDQNIRKVQASVEDWMGGKTMFRPHLFNKILALDNIYHYPEKVAFLKHCMAMLPPGGAIGVTDILLKDSKLKSPPAWVKVALSLMGVTANTVWTESTYRRHLTSLGFCNVRVKRIGLEVFSGWIGILPQALLQYLDYAIIVASKEGGRGENETPNLRKKRVAVIGSGMAGLAAAYAINSSSRSEEVEVKIYDVNTRPGLAGNTMFVGDQLVDVPARMAALGYYTEYVQLLEQLGIPYQVLKADCVFHGGNGAGGYVKRIIELSAWTNFFNSVFVSGLRNLWKMHQVFSDTEKMDPTRYRDLSFGDWLHKHFKLFPPSSPKSSDSSKHQGWQFSYFAQHENPFLYMAIGSIAWMLSCTYQQLIACPADIVLPYIQGLGWTGIAFFTKKGDAVRIEPSIKALEHALLYGAQFQGDTKVADVDKTKIIDGIEYDAVICATEASAVPYVIQNSAKVFSLFHYHPSTIYLHRDPSLMPKNRADWRTWDVRMEPNGEEPQLTFWLNRYYDHISFDGDVFQTWAPLHPPRDEFVIQKSILSRVTHTSASKELVKRVEAEQGKDNIYYAGSYVVYGMGLLEQAAASGRIAGERVLDDLFQDSKDII